MPPIVKTMPTKRTIITLVAGLGLLAVAALSNWHTSGQLQKTYGLVAQSHQVRASLTRLLAAVQDVQMGKRGIPCRAECHAL